MKDEFKVVARFNDVMSAEIAAGQLKANGIMAAVFNEVSALPAFNETCGVVVKVNAKDYDQALSILSASSKAE